MPMPRLILTDPRVLELRAEWDRWHTTRIAICQRAFQGDVTTPDAWTYSDAVAVGLLREVAALLGWTDRQPNT